MWTASRLLRASSVRTPAMRQSLSSLAPDLSSSEMEQFTQERIRNFCIIAHIDHGKSTLADRLLELTGTIRSGTGVNFNRQVLDKLKVERDRGITVKAQSASMFHKHTDGKTYLLNLIDTPGHVDFTYEVTRSMAACQGAILLVDANQGVQAQTLANYYLALSHNLTVVPVLNKIDLQGADPEGVAKQIESTLDINLADEIVKISAKTNLNVPSVLSVVVDKFPSPKGDRAAPLRALLFDSWFDEYRGVICLVSLVDGVLRKGDRIVTASSDNKYEVHEIGIMHPEQKPTDVLFAGQVGYAIFGMKTAKEARVGDTLYHHKSPVEPLPGFQPAKPMVFAGIFPAEADEFDKLAESLERLTLNDNSVTIQKETSVALGQGWRIGFLGLLHMDVFIQRLEQEHDSNVIATTPTVPYKDTHRDGSITFMSNPTMFPSEDQVKQIVFEEPVSLATMIFPKEYLGPMIQLCEGRRGVQLELSYISDTRVLIRYRLPLSEMITDFFDEIKSISAGYVSLDYEDGGYEKAPLCKLEILLNGKPVDALSAVVHRDHAVRIGKDLVHRLKETIPKQLYEVAIQACVGSSGTKVVARETLSAMRKNVTARCYGGDVTRKMKLLNKQKEGKKKMKMIGNVELPHSAFVDLMRKRAPNA